MPQKTDTQLDRPRRRMRLSEAGPTDYFAAPFHCPDSMWERVLIVADAREREVNNLSPSAKQKPAYGGRLVARYLTEAVSESDPMKYAVLDENPWEWPDERISEDPIRSRTTNVRKDHWVMLKAQAELANLEVRVFAYKIVATKLAEDEQRLELEPG